MVFIDWFSIYRLFWASEAGPPNTFERFPKLNLNGLVFPFANSSSIPITSILSVLLYFIDS